MKIAKLFDLEGMSIEDKFFKIIFLQDHCGCLEIWAHSLLDHKKILLLENLDLYLIKNISTCFSSEVRKNQAYNESIPA